MSAGAASKKGRDNFTALEARSERQCCKKYFQQKSARFRLSANCPFNQLHACAVVIPCANKVRQHNHQKAAHEHPIFFSTVVTHLFGGSAGREGAALQLGGSIASFGKYCLYLPETCSITTQNRMLSKAQPIPKSPTHQVELNEREERIMTMCGMAAGFSALFGTPLTAVSTISRPPKGRSQSMAG